MTKLGYDPKLITIVTPVLDNSQIIKTEKIKTSFSSDNVISPPQPSFKPPEIINIDDWSDFEDD